MDSTELVKRLTALDTCAVSDALDSLGLNGVVTGLARRSTNELIAGRVQTVKLSIGTTPGGSSAHLGSRSIEEAWERDIIVVEQRSGVDAAGWGGVLAVAARAKGIQGVIVEGPARDIDEYQKIGFPVFSRSTTPRTARGRVQSLDFKRAHCHSNSQKVNSRSSRVQKAAAIDAARQWTFRPAQRAGAAVGITVLKPFRFVLESR